MKVNWINLLATLLILGGVVLLVGKKMGKSTVPGPTTVSTQEAKTQFVAWLEGQMGRKLNDTELQMIETVQNGNQVKIVLHEPLAGRVAEVWAKYKAAQAKASTTQGSVPGGIPAPPPNTTLEVAPAPATAP